MVEKDSTVGNVTDDIGVSKFVKNNFPFDGTRYVIKKSKHVKFDKFYEEKLIQIIEKLVK